MRMPTTDREWGRALVYGAGLSGRAAARLLLARGVEVVLVDSRAPEALDLGDLATASGLVLEAGREPDTLPEGVDGVVVSPGVPTHRPALVAAREAGLEILAEIELGFRLLEGRVVAITGSNGKSTTTALVGAMLEAAGHRVEVCGNIGAPLASRVDGPADRVFVVEVSSFQLETVDSFRPDAGALLNLSPDHLDRHVELLRYLETKARLFRRQRPSDVAILNADDPLVSGVEAPGRVRAFSRLRRVVDGCSVVGDRVVELGRDAAGELFHVDEVGLLGTHNLENAMAAALVARSVEASPEAIVEGLRTFPGLPHRLQLVADRQGVRWLDDSKGTNPAATVRSLEGFEAGTVHLILGGRAKGTGFDDLRPPISRAARRVYLIGEAADALHRVLSGSVETERVETLERAVARAAEEARSGEVVVLSPACASFDQFRDYVQRGEAFQALVRDLPTPEGAVDAGA